MSFAAETEKLVNNLIQAEYENACEKFGEKYHSLHEGYAVLLEEVEEVEENIEHLKEEVYFMWKCIKRNNVKYGFSESLKDSFDIFIQNAIKELAQVGAVLMKIKNTFGDVEDDRTKR